MSPTNRPTRSLPDLLAELAPPRVPDYFDDMLKATARTRQRPAWTSLERLLPMQVSARLAPLGLPSWRPLVLLLVLAGLLLALATTFLVGASQRPRNVVDGTFTLTGSMGVERERPTATLLRDGRVLVAGGYPLQASRTSEVFDPVTGQFTPSGDLLHARYDASAVRLEDGRVLIVGGVDPNATSGDGTAYTVGEAEVWDPATNLFTPFGTLREARMRPFLRALADGGVVVSGGFAWNGADSRPISTGERWDPPTKTFASMPSDGNPPVDPSQVAGLTDGRSLVLDDTGARVGYPSTGPLSATGSPLSPRDVDLLTVTQLSDGRVLLVGGLTVEPPGEAEPVAEIWDPATGQFRLTGSTVWPRERHSAVRLADGRILILGNNLTSGTMTSAEIFDPG